MRTLKIVFYALLAGQLASAGALYYTMSQADAFSRSDNFGMGIMVPVMMAALIGASFAYYNWRKKQVNPSASEAIKMNAYFVDSIIRLALIEAANLTALVFMFTLSNPILMLLFAIGFGIFYLCRPSENQFNQDYLKRT